MSRTNNEFSYLLERQKTYHCGPCSLSYCLYMLGVERDQAVLGNIARTRANCGTGEQALMRTARKYKVTCREVTETNRQNGKIFAERLQRHLQTKGPALLCVDEHGFNGHWVAVIGWVNGKFVVDDPLDKDKFFWCMTGDDFIRYAWNECDSCTDGEQRADCTECEGEPDQFSAILLRRADGKEPQWTLTKEFMWLCREGSYCTASGMHQDLRNIVDVCSPGKPSPNRLALRGLLETYTGAVRSVLDLLAWNDHRMKLTKAEAIEFYQHYLILADAAGLTYPKEMDKTAFLAHLTALVVTAAWVGEL